MAELRLNLSRVDELLVGYRILTMCRPGTVLARDEAGEPVFRQPDGDWMSSPLENMAVGIRTGKIAWIVPEAAAPPGPAIPSRNVGRGQLLTPALIDCHTHLVHAGNRADEWAARLGGRTYAEISRSGGGILSTVRQTRAASEDQLVEQAAGRLVHWLREGVMTVEIKSGYGLELETELRMLRAARRLERMFPIRIVTTLLAAHAVPPEFAGRSDDYVTWVCNEMIPAADGLCAAVDVFCESIAFSLDQTARIFDAAQAAGLTIKVHAEQLTRTGAAVMAAQRGALSADHLEFLSEADCEVLAGTSTVATLLPGAFYCLRERQLPPVAALIRAGVPVAVATDSNPGSSPLSSLLLAANMACNLFGLTPGQALAGVTCHAAQALGLAGESGSLAPGSRADCCVWRMASVAELLYRPGHVPPVNVLVAGKPRLVLEAPPA